MREVCQLAARVATTEAAVLIHGEPGVGKELLARTIHRQSRRAAGAFVHVNCGAIREANLESWLFGSRRSHFLSGDQTCWGLLREAHGGTVFLSNVESLPVWAQIQLCDTLQGNGIAGSATSSPTAFDVRRIASVSCNLEEAVAEGRFYGGLYYLLNVVALRIPPLRLRQRDIKILAESYLAQILAKQGAANRRPHHFTEEAWQCLLNYDWPGNLPELANVVARAVALADGPEIGGRAIALAPRKIRDDRSDTISVPFTGSLREIEQCIIEEVIQRCDGNKAAAARALGLHRRTLYRMLEEGAGDEVSREPD
jgi:DNA-binding NtrC family response regulator